MKYSPMGNTAVLQRYLKQKTCNVAEALYLNKQFGRLLLILGATRCKAWHRCKSPFVKDQYGIMGWVMNIWISLLSVKKSQEATRSVKKRQEC